MDIHMDKTVIVCLGEKYIELPYGRQKSFDYQLRVCPEGVFTTRFEDSRAYLNDKELSGSPTQMSGLVVQVFESNPKSYSTRGIADLSIGKGERKVIMIEVDAEMLIRNGELIVFSGNVYLNGSLCRESRYTLRVGDCLLIGSAKFYFNEYCVTCDGTGYRTNLPELFDTSDIGEDFPQYKRSPRIIKREPTETIDIKDPPSKRERSKGTVLTMLMPLVMMCVTVVLGIFMKRGWMILMSAVMMMASAGFAAVRFISDGRSLKEDEAVRIAEYKEYLLGVRKQLNAVYCQQKESANYHNPRLADIERMVKKQSGRIYEHGCHDADFMCFSLGHADALPTYTVKYNNDDIAKQKTDELQQEKFEVISGFTMLPELPVVCDLKKSHLAYVGEKNNVHEQLTSLIIQLSFFQSYHDLNIIMLTDEESRREFEWMRWLPHCRLRSINTLTVISSENQRDKVMGNIASQLKERKLNRDEQKKNSFFLPFFVFIIDNPKLIMSHNIMEYLQGDDRDLGFSVVYTTNLKSNVPENIKTVLLLESREYGNLLLQEGCYANRRLYVTTGENVNAETFSRSLCPVIHNKGITTQIPDMLTFFDMYGISFPEELPIRQMWGQSACNKSLAVPIGARAANDYVMLNLHEKAHGPHGLIAGTTGSGKSEAIQSYILSLAINFHPYDVGFLLIDYKGGGMAKLFEKLPHVLGIITNLDGSESLRALASIKSELARRQRVFNDCGVNNINDYTKIFKKGMADEPLPHLFIVADEFAELKKEQPEFMKELVSAARIGRSLGVHLLLATQKPSGVVDDQIWSNSRFKLALKVQTEADSNEILKTPDAAKITKSGRAYLQIGNNEIYELFQTAWSGAPFKEDEATQAFDGRVYLENASGQGELLNPDLDMATGESGLGKTQLDVLVERIAAIYTSLGIRPVMRPWLPPLPEQLVTGHINPLVDVGRFTDYTTAAPLGLVDLPEEQRQIEYIHDFIQDGNLAFFGASGYGKSVSILLMTMELASVNSPELLQFYIVDFGNSSLVPLKNLPHTADYITYDDTEKLQKLIKLITDEIAARKRLFAKENAVSFKMYNQAAKKRLPIIILEIDNFDVIRELGTAMDEAFVKIMRDGTSLGIYTMISASRVNAVKYSILNSIKSRVVFYNYEQGDAVAAIGHSSYKLTEVKGRALVKMKEPRLMQSYLPAAYDNDLAYAAQIQDMISSIVKNNTVQGPKAIPVLPEEVYYHMLDVSDDKRRVAVGLDADSVHTQYMDMSSSLQLIVGAPKTGKTNLLKLIIRQFDGVTLFVSDSKSRELWNLAEQSNVTMVTGANDAASFCSNLQIMAEQRKALYEESDKSTVPRKFYLNTPPVYLLIDDVDYFVEAVKSVAGEMEKLLADFEEIGVGIIATTLPGKMRGYDNITKRLREAQTGVVLGMPSDQTFFSVNVERGYKAKVDMGFIVQQGVDMKVKIPVSG